MTHITSARLTARGVGVAFVLAAVLSLNAFALNWKDEKGNLNTDLEEANYFMKKIVDKLSVTSANTDPTTIPIFLTSTQFSHDDYGDCAKKFMERIAFISKVKFKGVVPRWYPRW